MGNYSELPVYKATYDLLLEMFVFTKDFNKEYKYTVGESLKKETIELITLIYRANSRSDRVAVIGEAPNPSLAKLFCLRSSEYTEIVKKRQAALATCRTSFTSLFSS